MLSSTSFITDHFHFTLVLQRLPSKKRRGRGEVGRPFWTFPFPRIDENPLEGRGPPRRRREREREKGDGYKKKKKKRLENVGKRASRRGSHEKRAERRTD